jgi:hypothetical protein
LATAAHAATRSSAARARATMFLRGHPIDGHLNCGAL